MNQNKNIHYIHDIHDKKNINITAKSKMEPYKTLKEFNEICEKVKLNKCVNMNVNININTNTNTKKINNM